MVQNLSVKDTQYQEEMIAAISSAKTLLIKKDHTNYFITYWQKSGDIGQVLNLSTLFVYSTVDTRP